MLKLTGAPLAALAAISLGGCAHTEAGHGALAGAGAGAVVGALTGGNVIAGAAIGAAAGAVAGSLIHKNDKCYRVDNDGNEHEVHC